MYAKIHYEPPKGGAFAPSLPPLNPPLTNIWAFTKTNALDIFPYQSCLSRAKYISVVFITWEIHISRVSHDIILLGTSIR